jgi:hypothetical protein
MHNFWRLLSLAGMLLWQPMVAYAADFSINSAIIEFNKDGPRQQDIILGADT